MPETTDKQLHRRHSPRSNPIPILNISPRSRLRYGSYNALPRQQATDFTATQQLKLRAGDMRMARMQISLTKLRLEMEQSGKLVEQLCQEAELEMRLDKRQ